MLFAEWLQWRARSGPRLQLYAQDEHGLPRISAANRNRVGSGRSGPGVRIHPTCRDMARPARSRDTREQWIHSWPVGTKQANGWGLLGYLGQCRRVGLGLQGKFPGRSRRPLEQQQREIRAAYRHWATPSARDSARGFRLALERTENPAWPKSAGNRLTPRRAECRIGMTSPVFALMLAEKTWHGPSSGEGPRIFCCDGFSCGEEVVASATGARLSVRASLSPYGAGVREQRRTVLRAEKPAEGDQFQALRTEIDLVRNPIASAAGSPPFRRARPSAAGPIATA